MKMNSMNIRYDKDANRINVTVSTPEGPNVYVYEPRVPYVDHWRAAVTFLLNSLNTYYKPVHKEPVTLQYKNELTCLIIEWAADRGYDAAPHDEKDGWWQWRVADHSDKTWYNTPLSDMITHLKQFGAKR